MKEYEVEIVLWDWLKTKGINIKGIYFNRTNKLGCKTFTTSGVNKKPDFIIGFVKYSCIEYLAVEIKPMKSSRDVHDSGKILMYYENYVKGKTKYFIGNEEIKINHFGIATENSINGKLFEDDNLLISNSTSSDNWRKLNAQLKLIPEFEYQRTSDFLRRLWSEWRNLKKRININKDLPSIGIIISNPNKDKLPYLLTMAYLNWLQKPQWGQRFWKL